MTSLLGAKKRAEEFAAAVDADSATGLRPELSELVDVVSALRTAAPASPRAEFSLALRERLMAEAEASLATNATLTLPPRRRGARERRLVVAASAFVLVGGSAGMAAAAQDALPGDALYPIKRGLEKAQTDLSTSEASKGRHLLEQASGRLGEVESLLAGAAASTQVPDTIDAFTVQAQQGADLLLSSFEADRDPSDIEALRRFAADGILTLQDLARTAPAEAQDELTNAALALQRIDAAATSACSSCAADLPTLQLPTMFLTAAEAGRALNAVKAHTLNNDHPVMTQQPKGGQPGTTDQPEAPADGPSEQPYVPPTGENPLGTLPADGPKDAEDVAELGEQVIEDVVEGVKDATAPILPDELDPVVDTVLP